MRPTRSPPHRPGPDRARRSPVPRRRAAPAGAGDRRRSRSGPRCRATTSPRPSGGRSAPPSARCSRTCPASRPPLGPGRQSGATRCRAQSARTGDGALRTPHGRRPRRARSTRHRCGCRRPRLGCSPLSCAGASRSGARPPRSHTDYGRSRASDSPLGLRAGATEDQLAASNFAPTTSQLTTFHQAAR